MLASFFADKVTHIHLELDTAWAESSKLIWTIFYKMISDFFEHVETKVINKVFLQHN